MQLEKWIDTKADTDNKLTEGLAATYTRLLLHRPSTDAVDGLDNQVKNLETQLVSLKQSHQEELKNLKDEAKAQQEGYDKEKNE